MRKVDILIIGAGPAGLAAAIELSRNGLCATVVEQRQTIGGAIYRQPAGRAAAIAQPPNVKARWLRLNRNFSRCGVAVLHGSVFLGIDGSGLAMVENRASRLVEHFSARAVIIATGAVEKVLPRHGWQIAGVSTAGGLQMMMKETGKAPEGRIMIGGSGPLLLAVAAQMARLGNPPIAVAEAADPLRHPLDGIALATGPGLLAEAALYLKDFLLLGIPWLRGTTVTYIARQADGLVATLRDRHGAERRVAVDRIGLHDGIRPNNFGLPQPVTGRGSMPTILHAGDCREALGAVAAEADGVRAAQQVATLLGTRQGNAVSAGVERQRKLQARLSKVFSPVQRSPLLANVDDETVLCRCENRTLGDLKALCGKPDPLSGREVKHNGRFAMGACQGRFCAENTARLMAELRPDMPAPSASDLTGLRWPLRPVSIGALVRGSQNENEQQ